MRGFPCYSKALKQTGEEEGEESGKQPLMNIQLNLHIQHLAFHYILYDMRTSVSSQHLYQ